MSHQAKPKQIERSRYHIPSVKEKRPLYFPPHSPPWAAVSDEQGRGGIRAPPGEFGSAWADCGRCRINGSHGLFWRHSEGRKKCGINPKAHLLVRSNILSGTLISTLSVHSFPRVGHGVGQSPLISSRNFGNTSKTMAQITI